MEERYVEAFLQRGELRISSFAAFRKHKDEQRGDTEEGSAMAIGHDIERQRSFGVFSTVGSNAYVLSTMLYPEPKLRSELGDGCLEIGDVDQFACQVANELAGCTGIFAGPCVYVDARILNQQGMELPPDRFRDDNDPTRDSLDKILAASNEVSGPRQFFLKHSRYQHQCEYRFIWHMNRPTRDYIDVALPAPPGYCQKV